MKFELDSWAMSGVNHQFDDDPTPIGQLVRVALELHRGGAPLELALNTAARTVCTNLFPAAHFDDPLARLLTMARAGMWPGLAHISARFIELVAAGLSPAAALEADLDEHVLEHRAEAFLHRWRAQARRLHSPQAVARKLPIALRGLGLRIDPLIALEALVLWVADRTRYISDASKWGQPDLWQPPSQTLIQHSGDCEDWALVIWSAARACGLPSGRLVVGSVVDLTHCWVEFPELGIGTDPVARLLWHDRGRPIELHPWLSIAPPTGAVA